MVTEEIGPTKLLVGVSIGNDEGAISLDNIDDMTQDVIMPLQSQFPPYASID
jgi:hypothetical protein